MQDNYYTLTQQVCHLGQSLHVIVIHFTTEYIDNIFNIIIKGHFFYTAFVRAIYFYAY